MKKKNKKVKKIKKKELTPQQKRQKKIDAIKEKYIQYIKKFNEKHFVYMFCYPSGRKLDNKGNDISDFTRTHIYVCKEMCEHGSCREFERKIYLCRDLDCKEWPICMFSSEDKMKKICKKKKLWDKRKKLEKIYEKFLFNYKIYRGFKIDQEKTLKFLKKRAEKNGKIRSKADRTKGSTDRKKKTKSNKKGLKKKRVIKNNS